MNNTKDQLSIQLRNFAINDYSAVRKILEEADLFDQNWDSEEKLSKRIREKPDSIIVACVDGEVIGNVFLVDDLFPYIYRLAVKKQFRNHGIGKMLVLEGEKRLKSHGHQEIAILVDDLNEELKLWYIKQGFILAGQYRGMWKKI